MLNPPFRLALVLSLLSAAAPAQPSDWGPAPGSKPAYSVVYTGRLLGYFRYPDEQSTNESGCPSLSSNSLPAQVAAFRATRQQIQAVAQAPQVLVSLGDNFAPELLARSLRNREPGTAHLGDIVSKELFTPDPNGEIWHPDSELQSGALAADTLRSGKVPSDNVACFMRLAAINAVVPGQQDFYFGPERLRELARFLAQDATSDYAPVQMLAANLSVTTTMHNPVPRLPSGALPKAIQTALTPSPQVHFQLPAAVMPWLLSVPITSDEGRFTVYDCIASPADPQDFALPSQLPNNCSQLEEDSSRRGRFDLRKPSHPSANFLADYYTLDPGDNHALCVEHQEKGVDSFTCSLFSVQYPFFQYRPNSSGATPRPYYLSPDAQGGTAVFGALDPDMAAYVGQFEDTWTNLNSRFDTRVGITDPIEALRQELDLCASDVHCRDRHKILLAQMPYYQAAQLAGKLKEFDIIIAQADQLHATANESSSRILDATSQPLLLTPGFAFDSSRDAAIGVNLRTADVYFENGSNGLHKQFLANTVYDPVIFPPSHVVRPALHALETGSAKVSDGKNPLGSAKSYEALALTSMQQFCSSDIALLQHRDVFTSFQKAIAYWPDSFRFDVQELLEEVLWKGDFAFCLPVKGSTLKKMLSESAAFDREDSSDLSLEVLKGRGLSTLGITLDPSSGAFIVRGRAVDDDQLYGVAMTDYLAFGDTGYPELSSEAVLPRVRVTSLKELNRLTGLACERLPLTATRGECQSEEIDASQYFDAIALSPFDPSAGLSALRQLRVWATHPLQPQPVSTFLSKNDGTPESALEHRGLWWFTVQNVSLEYELAFIRGSDKSVPVNFSGINTFSQLSTPESSQLSLWTRIRGGYSFPRFIDFYSAGEERYTRAAVRESDASGSGNFGPYQLTLNNNIVRGELGLISKPFSRLIPIRALASENLFTQVSDPFDQLAVPVAGVPRATTLTTLDLGKNFVVMTRLGARLQNKESWFEAGREYGENIGIPIGYRLQDPGRLSPLSCNRSGNYSLSSCISSDPLFTTQSRVLPNLENQAISGWFMDFHTVAPLIRSRLQLTVDSYAEKFDKRASDTSFNTRFYEDLTVALKVPIWGNLSFAPQVEAFLFQNKVIPNQTLFTTHYTFITSSLKLEYGFDWHRGVGVKRALRYPGGISTTASPLTTAP